MDCAVRHRRSPRTRTGCGSRPFDEFVVSVTVWALDKVASARFVVEATSNPGAVAEATACLPDLARENPELGRLLDADTADVRIRVTRMDRW